MQAGGRPCTSAWPGTHALAQDDSEPEGSRASRELLRDLPDVPAGILEAGRSRSPGSIHGSVQQLHAACGQLRAHCIHVIHLEGRHDEGRDAELEGRLASRAAIPYSEAGYFLGSPRLYRAAAEALRRHPVDFLVAEFEKAFAQSEN